MERDDSVDISSTPVLENPEHQTKWYYKYFLGKFHQNYIGHEIHDSANNAANSAASNGGGVNGGDVTRTAFVLSVLKERSFGKILYRTILWTKDGPKRLCVNGGSAASSGRSEGSSLSAKQILAHFGHVERVEKAPREVSKEGVLVRQLGMLEKAETFFIVNPIGSSN